MRSLFDLIVVITLIIIPYTASALIIGGSSGAGRGSNTFTGAQIAPEFRSNSADGTHGMYIGNSVPYTGPRTKGTVFHNMTAMYYCEQDNVCRRYGTGVLSAAVIAATGSIPVYAVIASSQMRVNNIYVVEAANITLTMRNYSAGKFIVFNNSTGAVKLKPSALGQRWRYKNFSAANNNAKFKKMTTANGYSIMLPPGETLEMVSYGSPFFTAIMPTIGLAKTGVNEYAAASEPATGTILFGSSTEDTGPVTVSANDQIFFVVSNTATWSESASTTTVGSIEVWLSRNVSDTAVNCKAYITDTSNTIITNGISNALAVPSGTNVSWKSFTMGTPPIVTKNTAYRIGLVCDGQAVYRFTSTGTATIAYKAGSYASPQNITSPTTIDATSTMSGMRAKK